MAIPLQKIIVFTVRTIHMKQANILFGKNADDWILKQVVHTDNTAL
jgi:hypothetical protein